MPHTPYRRPHGLRELSHSPEGLILADLFRSRYGFSFRVAVRATRACPVLTIDARYLGKVSG